MNNFTFQNPTKIYFGEGQLDALSLELPKYGKGILLAYGGGSIKKSGLYDKVVAILKKAGKSIYELSGITPNPRTEKVYEGVDICKRNNISLILAVGGGSVIDCCKAIAAGAKTDLDFWQAFFIDGEKCLGALPIGVVLTIPATGSEMNGNTVVTRWNENHKTNYGSPMLYPKFSILDPTYTFTLPKEQIVYGAIDILAHVFEAYFSAPDDGNLSDDISEAIIKNTMANLDAALKNPLDYTARSNLMWDGTMALNGLIGLGKNQDWNTHMIEHVLSGYYDIPHGAGLSIVFPAWMKYIRKNCLERFVRFAKNIWDISTKGKTDDETALAAIASTKAYFKKVGAPVSFKDANIPADKIREIASRVELRSGGYAPLSTQDIVNILNLCI